MASVLTAELCLHPESSTVEVRPGLSLGIRRLLGLLPPYSAAAGTLRSYPTVNCVCPGGPWSSELLQSAPWLAKAESQPSERELK